MFVLASESGAQQVLDSVSKLVFSAEYYTYIVYIIAYTISTSLLAYILVGMIGWQHK